jgi:aspartate-semialdehyde dehydrogenase
VAVTTFQSLSGRGDAKYPRDAVMGNVYPLHGTVERTGEFQHAELKRMMPGINKVSVAAYRVPVQRCGSQP